jgi:hypothetical protein
MRSLGGIMARRIALDQMQKQFSSSGQLNREFHLLLVLPATFRLICAPKAASKEHPRTDGALRFPAAFPRERVSFRLAVNAKREKHLR